MTIKDDAVAYTITVVEKQRDEALKRLSAAEKQNTKLWAALQRIVDDCDLPYEAYGKLERKAIANAREALGVI